MTPAAVEPQHYSEILRNNARFVHWLSPLDEGGLIELLRRADYARQLLDGAAVAIAYDGHSEYRHKNVDWLSERLDNFFYIDRVIVGGAAQRQGAGRALYRDLDAFARAAGHTHIACEVNTAPDNPDSHHFHRSVGFTPLGDVEYTGGSSVRYYVKKLEVRKLSQ